MYANGMVPLSVLVHVVGNIWLPPGTAARFAWAFEAAFQKYGVRLRFTPDRDGLGGWNGYRPKSAQVLYKKRYGNKAAAVGFSTHGGNVSGREIFAADIDNWAELGWARFAAIMRLAGLTVDYVTPREEWHVVDLNNPWMVPAFAGSATTGEVMNANQEAKLDQALKILNDVGGRVWNQTLSVPAELSNVPGFAEAKDGRMPAKEFVRYAPQFHRDLALRENASTAELEKRIDALDEKLDSILAALKSEPS